MIRNLSKPILLLLFMFFSAAAAGAIPGSGIVNYCKLSFSKQIFYQNVFDRSSRLYLEKAVDQVEFKEILKTPEKLLAFLNAQSLKVLGPEYSIEKMLNAKTQKEKNKLKKSIALSLDRKTFTSSSFRKLSSLASGLRDTESTGILNALRAYANLTKLHDRRDKTAQELVSLEGSLFKELNLLFLDNNMLDNSSLKFRDFYHGSNLERSIGVSLVFYVLVVSDANSFSESIGAPLFLAYLPFWFPDYRLIHDFLLRRKLKSKPEKSYQNSPHFFSLSRSELLKSTYLAIYFSLFSGYIIADSLQPKEVQAEIFSESTAVADAVKFISLASEQRALERTTRAVEAYERASGKLIDRKGTFFKAQYEKNLEFELEQEKKGNYSLQKNK